MFTEYSIWLLPVIVVVSGLLTYWAYFYKLKRQVFTRKQLYVLVGLRFLGLFLILFLLLSPVRTVKVKSVEKPTIVVCQDNSQSIVFDKKKFNKKYFSSCLQDLQSVCDDLKKDYNVVRISFAQEPKELKDNQSFVEAIKFDGCATNISSCLDYVNETYAFSNLSSVVLSSDGIYTQGRDYLNLKDDFSYPIYTVAMGDTSTVMDLQISDVQYNNIVFKDNDYPIEITIRADKASNNSSSLFMVKDGKTTLVKNFTINSDDYTIQTQLKLNSKHTGIEKITFYTTTLNSEKNTKNNRKDIFIEVLDTKKKILILSAYPHADISALKTSISLHKAYLVEEAIFGQEHKDMNDYDLVILHNLPNNSVSFNSIKQMIENHTPLLFILGEGYSSQYFNALNTGIRVNNLSTFTNKVLALYNEAFSGFTLLETANDVLRQLPPLSTLTSKYELSPNVQTLLFQKVGSVNTSYPLIAFNKDVSNNFGFIVGENLWRWRLQNYLLKNNFDVVDELIGKTIELSSNRNKNERLRVQHKDIYSQDEDVIFTAQLYNDNYEMINSPEIDLILKGKTTKTYYFGKTNNSYYLNLSQLDSGEYSFEAKTEYNNKTLVKKGFFVVSSTNEEFLDVKAKHSQLYTLSQKTNAKMLYPQNVKQLKDLIIHNDNIKPIIHQTIENRKLISLWQYWMIIILCLASEWFLRKYWGRL